MSESFDWNYPGLDWSHFHSLANLLSLRNGGQAEPSSLSDMVLEEDWDLDDNEDGDAPSIDTRFAHQISNSGHGRLKQWRFLMTNFYPLTEVGESEMEPELRSEVEVEPEVDEDSAGLPSLFSSLWRFIGRFVS